MRVRLGILLGTLTLIASAKAQDVGAGQKLFKADCAICHSPLPGRNLVGPSLFNIIDRHSGVIPGFHYSDANKSSNLTWNISTLDRYLTSPRKLVPGTKMTFPGLSDAKQRADLIAYLATLH